MTREVSAEATSARRPLLVAGVVLLVMAALTGPLLLVVRGGQSSAAFGDNHQLGSNHLGSATLDIEVGQQSTSLSTALMAPGDTVTGWLDLANRGDITLRYSILSDNGDDLLLDWLTWDIWSRRTCSTVPAPEDRIVAGEVLSAGATRPLLGNVEIGLDPGDRVLRAGEVERICLAVTLPHDAPDTLQGRSVSQALRIVAEHHLDDAT